MELEKVRKWESAVDSVEQTPLAAELPADAAVGDFYLGRGSDGIVRKWRRVLVVSGNVGGRWAYWVPWQEEVEKGQKRPGIGPHPDGHVVADKIFNGDAAHFVGMLSIPYTGKIPGADSKAWVLVEPRVEGPRVQYAVEEREPTRYEKSGEIYEVETGKSRPVR